MKNLFDAPAEYTIQQLIEILKPKDLTEFVMDLENKVQDGILKRVFQVGGKRYESFMAIPDDGTVKGPDDIEVFYYSRIQA